MTEKIHGKILQGVGGLYTVLVTEGELCGSTLPCRARGSFRHNNLSPLAGDNVVISPARESNDKKQSEYVIEDICDRRSALIRPPLANLDYLFITLAAASPKPILATVDKLISIAEFNDIEPIIVITKCELDRPFADELAEIYRKAGFETIVTSAETGEGIDTLRAYIEALPKESISAFSGASGVGKSTLLNSLFPSLELSTSSVSRKTERGRHTTRQTELYEINGGESYLADTPGFTMLDFEQFDFFTIDDLPFTMRDFEGYIGTCKYKKCSHTKEEGCSIVAAVKSGEISSSRHKSYLSLYEILKAKKKW